MFSMNQNIKQAGVGIAGLTVSTAQLESLQSYWSQCGHVAVNINSLEIKQMGPSKRCLKLRELL